MSVFKTTFSRALNAIPSDNNNIPFPNAITTRANTSLTLNRLNDASALFIANNVKTGDIVYNTTIFLSATVLEVLNENTLILNADIFNATGQQYTIYQASSQTGLGNQGCYLYIGNTSGGNNAVTVTTISGDFVEFKGLTSGTIIPVQVIALNSATTASSIIALW
jgi:hypothetical protein